jgi:hypothetical protein
MTRATRRLLRIILAATVAISCFLVQGDVWHMQSGSLVKEAHAIIGRPLTPLSYAGVARRTTYRAAVAGAAVAAPKCVQTVDAYGRTYTRCY